MTYLPPNINFARHEREAVADFQGQKVYSSTTDALEYANLRIYSREAAARLAGMYALAHWHRLDQMS